MGFCCFVGAFGIFLYLGFQEYNYRVFLYFCLEFAKLLEPVELCLLLYLGNINPLFLKLLYLVILLILSLAPQLPHVLILSYKFLRLCSFLSIFYSLFFRMNYFHCSLSHSLPFSIIVLSPYSYCFI